MILAGPASDILGQASAFFDSAIKEISGRVLLAASGRYGHNGSAVVANRTMHLMNAVIGV
jgi:hypothetical protein